MVFHSTNEKFMVFIKLPDQHCRCLYLLKLIEAEIYFGITHRTEPCQIISNCYGNPKHNYHYHDLHPHPSSTYIRKGIVSCGSSCPDIMVTSVSQFPILLTFLRQVLSKTLALAIMQSCHGEKKWKSPFQWNHTQVCSAKKQVLSLVESLQMVSQKAPQKAPLNTIEVTQHQYSVVLAGDHITI